MVIISANAGGAWSPVGDVTTTMLWIGGQVSALNIIVKTLLPGIVVVLLPLLILSFKFKMNSRPNKLSGGQQQRVAVARAINNLKMLNNALKLKKVELI